VFINASGKLDMMAEVQGEAPWFPAVSSKPARAFSTSIAFRGTN
jgi:hypothetical protein